MFDKGVCGVELPIWNGREKCGTLTVRREGLYAVFRAALPLREGLQRLWLCGEPGSVCLGVLQPRNGELRLEKRLSRAACAALPQPILRASLQRTLPAVETTVPKGRGSPQRVLLFGRHFIVFRS